jgi:hypothetical protein
MSDPRPARVVPEEEARSLLAETDGEGLDYDDRHVCWGDVEIAHVSADNADLAKLLAAAPDLAHTTLVLRSQIEKLTLERDLARHDRDQAIARVAVLESGSDQATKSPTTSDPKPAQRKIWHQV